VKADVAASWRSLAGRLIESTAKKLAGAFFEKFGSIVGKPLAPSEVEAAAATPGGCSARSSVRSAPYCKVGLASFSARQARYCWVLALPATPAA